MQQLTQDQVDHFNVEGYVILRDVFSRSEVETLLEAMADLLADKKRGTPGAGYDRWSTEPGDALNPHRVTYLNDIFALDDRLDAHMRDPRLAGAFCDLFGPDLNGYQSAAVIKTVQLNFDYHGWHQDAPDYMPLSNYKNACAITYLGAMGPDTGGTSLVPRSHRVGCLERGHVEVEGWPMKKRIIIGFEEYEPRVISPQFNPGDVLVFDSWIMHRANSNYTDESKIGLINVYMSRDCIDLEGKNKFQVADLPITRDRKVLSPGESRLLKEREVQARDSAG
ncbi:MAG: phytanoyl-CoA dioxygenase family protein [Planctomycetota bacterium]|nr:phytanoyl-CoA dioxygenase family protein [Planctomycetota bacterium]MDA1139045.1 phytanoyl-CoA dioxygenase family protein [Planctomycetota bacterium]